MTPSEEALERVRGYAKAGRYIISGHARGRMKIRRVQEADLQHALSHAYQCTLQENERWKVEGPDLDKDPLTAVVVFDDDLLVVTIY